MVTVSPSLTASVPSPVPSPLLASSLQRQAGASRPTTARPCSEIRTQQVSLLWRNGGHDAHSQDWYSNSEIGEVVKVVVLESVLKKRKIEEEWALAKKQGLEDTKKKNAENRKLIYNKSKQYTKEYAEKDNELVQLKREARLKGGFYAEPKSKLLFIIRIRGNNAIDPKTKKILRLL